MNADYFHPPPPICDLNGSILDDATMAYTALPHYH